MRRLIVSAGIAFESTDDPAVFKAFDRVGDSRSRWDAFWAPVRQLAVGPDRTVWALDGAAVWQVGSAESHALPIDPITLGGERVLSQYVPRAPPGQPPSEREIVRFARVGPR
jgi:hypothetical protein